jgi:hypothetical protein
MAGAATYQIIVQGTIGPSWANRILVMKITERRSENGQVETVLVGRLADQAVLSDVLNSLYELRLPVVSADCLDMG